MKTASMLTIVLPVVPPADGVRRVFIVLVCSWHEAPVERPSKGAVVRAGDIVVTAKSDHSGIEKNIASPRMFAGELATASSAGTLWDLLSLDAMSALAVVLRRPDRKVHKHNSPNGWPNSIVRRTTGRSWGLEVMTTTRPFRRK